MSDNEMRTELWQYRWTNPGNYPDQPASMLEWKVISPGIGQSIQEKCDELLAYRYKGIACYEVRALRRASQILTDEQVREISEKCLADIRGDAATVWDRPAALALIEAAIREAIGRGERG